MKTKPSNLWLLFTHKIIIIIIAFGERVSEKAREREREKIKK